VHIACMGEMRMCRTFVLTSLIGREIERVVVGRRIDLNKQLLRVLTECIWLRIGTSGGLL